MYDFLMIISLVYWKKKQKSWKKYEKWFVCLKPTPKIRPKDVIGAFEKLIGEKWWKGKSVWHLVKNM